MFRKTLTLTTALVVLMCGVAHADNINIYQEDYDLDYQCEVHYHNGRWLQSEACIYEDEPPVITRKSSEYTGGQFTFHYIESCVHYQGDTTCYEDAWSTEN